METKANSQNKLLDKLLKIDMFGESPSFKVKQSESYPSVCGTLLSAIIIVITLAYTIEKSSQLWQYGETQFESYEQLYEQVKTG